MKHGVPFDVAFSLDEDTRIEWLIRIGENGGKEFDFNACRWKTKQPEGS